MSAVSNDRDRCWLVEARLPGGQWHLWSARFSEADARATVTGLGLGHQWRLVSPVNRCPRCLSTDRHVRKPLFHQRGHFPCGDDWHEALPERGRVETEPCGAQLSVAVGGRHIDLGALLRRDWAVRVLDAWLQANRSRSLALDCVETLKAIAVLSDTYGPRGGIQGRRFEASSPDGARAAAAEAAWPDLPESVRAELGERP